MAGKWLKESWDREEEEPMGAKIDDNLRVTQVIKGTLADGKIQVGDMMKKVNNYEIRDKNHYYQLLKRCFSPTELTFFRRLRHLDNFERRDGFQYLILDVDCDKYPGKAFGLTLTNAGRGVFVSGTADVSDKFFRPLDRILFINGAPVKDKKAARFMFIKSKGHFQAIVESATTREIRKQVRMEISKRKSPNDMPPDVGVIVKEERKRWKESRKKPPKGILRATSCRTTKKQVSINPIVAETLIIHAHYNPKRKVQERNNKETRFRL